LIRKRGESTKKKVNDAINDATEGAINFIGSLPEAVQEPAANVFLQGVSWVETALGELIKQLHVVIDAVMDIMNKIYTALTVAVRAVGAAVMTAIDWIRGIFGQGALDVVLARKNKRGHHKMHMNSSGTKNNNNGVGYSLKKPMGYIADGDMNYIEHSQGSDLYEALTVNYQWRAHTMYRIASFNEFATHELELFINNLKIVDFANSEPKKGVLIFWTPKYEIEGRLKLSLRLNAGPNENIPWTVYVRDDE